MGRKPKSPKPDSFAPIPEALSAVNNPVVQARTQQTGRPRRDELEVLSVEMTKGKEYYLANGMQASFRNLVGELPIACSNACPYAASCYLDEGERPRTCGADASPHGILCPIECDLLYRTFYGYIAELMIDGQRLTEIQSAAELAGIQVWKRRVNTIIMEDSDGRLLIENAVGVTKQGDVAVNRQEHPLWNTRRYLEKREGEIKKEFLATRKDMLAAKLEEEGKMRKTLAENLSGVEIDADEADAMRGGKA